MTTIAADQPASAWRTLVRGLQLSPEFRVGLPVTLLLALVATAGRVVVPIAVQQTIDHGLRGPHGVDIGAIRATTAAAAATVLATMIAAYLMNVRLYRSTETGLAALRVRAFRHVHDLSVLHQAAERRGSLVSRVTSDVDEISQFMQWGGVMLLVSAGQVVLATVLMAYYSWQLTLLVYACFAPLMLVLRAFQRRLDRIYAIVRERVGEMLGAVGVLLGINGQLSAGRLVAFLFLVTLFVGPVQVATEVLNEAQTAVATCTGPTNSVTRNRNATSRPADNCPLIPSSTPTATTPALARPAITSPVENITAASVWPDVAAARWRSMAVSIRSAVRACTPYARITGAPTTDSATAPSISPTRSRTMA